MSKEQSQLNHLTPVKVTRRRVLQHDLDMYAAISGGPPKIVPRETLSVQSPARPSRALITRASGSKRKGWSISVLADYLGNLQMPQLAIRVVKPDVADWVRKLSVQALGRLQEAQDRLQAARDSHRQTHQRRKAG
jgi:hypothetical protein